MLKELKFVQGAVARKDLVPAMTHFRIQDGHVRSYNGNLALSSPIPFNIDCTPKAESLVKAISNCEDTISLNLTTAGRLHIQSGPFRAFVECVEGETPHVMPAGEEVLFDGVSLLEALKVLYPFVGNDASRPWSNGVKLHDKSAFATNNVTVVEYWIGTEVPFDIVIPRYAIKEMLRVNEPPTHAQVDKGSITFHYTDGRWIRSQLLSPEWPELERILNKPCNPIPVDPRLFEGMETLRNMVDSIGRLYIVGDIMRTHLGEQTGGTFDLHGIGFEGCYQIQVLSLLKGVVETADFSLYPAPCLFFGLENRIRGALLGQAM